MIVGLRIRTTPNALRLVPSHRMRETGCKSRGEVSGAVSEMNFVQFVELNETRARRSSQYHMPEARVNEVNKKPVTEFQIYGPSL